MTLLNQIACVLMTFVSEYQILQEFQYPESLKIQKELLEVLPKTLRKKAEPFIRPTLAVANKYGFDPLLIVSIMWTESTFNDKAVSFAGAEGLMQLMQATRQELIDKTKPKDLLVSQDLKLLALYPEANLYKNKKYLIKNINNIELGILYLKKMITWFDSVSWGILAYNMGPGWVIGKKRNNTPLTNIKHQYLDKIQRRTILLKKKSNKKSLQNLVGQASYTL